MDYYGFIPALRREGTAMVSAARKADLGTTVPSCPEWSMGDLLWHVGRIHRHRVWLIEEQPTPDRLESFELDRPKDAALIDWFEEGVERIADVFDGSSPKGAAWTWFEPEQTVGFWARRMAQETAVHRWDAENAAGAAEQIEPVLAADGVDEFLTVFLPMQSSWQPEKPLPGNGETIHVHATDAAGDWTVKLTEGFPAAERAHTKGDAAMRGPSSELLLTLWRRLPLETVERFGDHDLLERFWRWMDLS